MQKYQYNKIKNMFIKEIKSNPYNKKHYKQFLNIACSMISHENMHYIIFKKFIKNADIEINFILENKSDKFPKDIKEYTFKGTCILVTEPKEFKLPKYFPKAILLETIQAIYDVICRLLDIRPLAIFRVIKHYINNIIFYLQLQTNKLN